MQGHHSTDWSKQRIPIHYSYHFFTPSITTLASTHNYDSQPFSNPNNINNKKSIQYALEPSNWHFNKFSCLNFSCAWWYDLIVVVDLATSVCHIVLLVLLWVHVPVMILYYSNSIKDAEVLLEVHNKFAHCSSSFCCCFILYCCLVDQNQHACAKEWINPVMLIYQYCWTTFINTYSTCRSLQEVHNKFTHSSSSCHSFCCPVNRNR
jgi:hypothetical protein